MNEEELIRGSTAFKKQYKKSYESLQHNVNHKRSFDIGYCEGFEIRLRLDKLDSFPELKSISTLLKKVEDYIFDNELKFLKHFNHSDTNHILSVGFSAGDFIEYTYFNSYGKQTNLISFDKFLEWQKSI